MSTTHIGSRASVPHLTSAVGMARRDVTPPVGIRARNWGAADWDVSEGVHRPILLTALAIGTSDGAAQLLIALDGGVWRKFEDERKIRDHLLSEFGLKRENVLIALSHTHAGPGMCSGDVGSAGGEHVPAYMEAIEQAAIDAGREALDNRVAGRIEWSQGRSSLASNRDLDLNGRPLIGFNPEVAADDTVMVGRVTADDGRVLGTVVNYACHPTTLAWDNRLLSPDYVGAMRELVEDATGGPCLFLQGASGNLAPKEQYSGDVTLADRHGRSLGHAVMAALEDMPLPGTELELVDAIESGAPLAIWRGAPTAEETTVGALADAVELAISDLPTIEQLRERWSGINEHSLGERLFRAKNMRDDRVTGPTIQYPVWAWRWGGAILVGHPGEADSRFQLTLRERFPEHPIVVVNLVNGPHFGYVPTKEAYELGRYQAWASLLASGSLELLEEHACDQITRLLAGEGAQS